MMLNVDVDRDRHVGVMAFSLFIFLIYFCFSWGCYARGVGGNANNIKKQIGIVWPCV